MKMLEILISCFVFSSVSSALSLLFFSSQSFLEWVDARRYALVLARELMEESSMSGVFIDGIYTANVAIKNVDNFTESKEVKVSYLFRGRSQELTLNLKTADTTESEGQSSCQPTQDVGRWLSPRMTSFNLSTIAPSIKPTDIDAVGDYAFISSNDTSASSSDLYIFNIKDKENPSLVSDVDTGPGITSLSVAGNFAYLSNTSVNGQLQIVDISDLSSPQLASTFKLPGTYTDATIGNSIFYKANKIFLGTQKSQIAELHYIDVSDRLVPRELATYEMGNAINDIFAFKDKVYVASPHVDEMKSFSISSGSFVPFSSYNDPGSTGNGKRLSLFLDRLYVGKTQTFAREELLVVSATSSPPALILREKIGTSVEGVIGYGAFAFAALRKQSDGFQVFDVSSTTPRRVNVTTSLPAFPLNFDCDRDTFATIFEDSTFISFISPQ